MDVMRCKKHHDWTDDLSSILTYVKPYSFWVICWHWAEKSKGTQTGLCAPGLRAAADTRGHACESPAPVTSSEATWFSRCLCLLADLVTEALASRFLTWESEGVVRVRWGSGALACPTPLHPLVPLRRSPGHFLASEPYVLSY